MEQTIQQTPLIGMTLDQLTKVVLSGGMPKLSRQAACRMAI